MSKGMVRVGRTSTRLSDRSQAAMVLGWQAMEFGLDKQTKDTIGAFCV